MPPAGAMAGLPLIGLAAERALSGAPASGVVSQLLGASVSLAGRTGVVSSPAVQPPSLAGTHFTPTWSSANVRPGLQLPGPSASLMTNILPFASSALATPSQGVYVGEGLPPVPLKLANKIHRREFVEMAEMLPEFWPSVRHEESEGSSKPSPNSRRPRQVTEFITWLQCFATYTSVLAGHCPAVVPELMAYLVTIARVSQDFAGLCWVRYDAAFRRQAAITGDGRWSHINPSLYSICFTGRAQPSRRCELCFSANHSAKQCALVADPDPGLPERLKAVESAIVSLASPRSLEGRSPVASSVPVCKLFNLGRCKFTRCRFRHACNRCGEAHAALVCTKAPPPSPPASGTEGAQVPASSRALVRKEASRPY